MMENTSASHCSAARGLHSCGTSLPRTRNMGGRPTWMWMSVAFILIASRRTSSSFTTGVSCMVCTLPRRDGPVNNSTDRAAPQLLERFQGDGEERGDHGRIEVRPRAAGDLLARGLERHRARVRA